MDKRERNIEIANNILLQLGGYYRLKAMINIKDHVAVENGISFKFSGSKNCNYVKIVLTDKDLYLIEFGKLYNKKEKFADVSISIPSYKKIEEIEGIYSDMLINLFEDKTGLVLTL